MRDRNAPLPWLQLFRVVDTHTELSPDKENVFVRVDLVFDDDDEDIRPEEVAEWAAFGFLFTVATLSFHDARPRGVSGIDYDPNDAFTVADFFDCLSFKHGELHLQIDYVRGRSMKTSVTIRQDGSVTLTTLGPWTKRQTLVSLAPRQAADCSRPRPALSDCP